jgi:ABC-type Fe3+/spermidine/putrescine transport system ATPase subunit
VTTVFVTHDQQEALALADRIAIMDAGVCRQVGKPDEVYNRPADRFVAKFLGKANLLPAHLLGMSGNAVVMVRPENIVLRAFPRRDEKLHERTIVENGTITVTATVMRAIFEGPIAQYTLDGNGVTITARQFHHGQPPFQPGEMVLAVISESGYHILAS